MPTIYSSSKYKIVYRAKCKQCKAVIDFTTEEKERADCWLTAYDCPCCGNFIPSWDIKLKKVKREKQ